jgi:hypothetical protein
MVCFRYTIFNTLHKSDDDDDYDDYDDDDDDNNNNNNNNNNNTVFVNYVFFTYSLSSQMAS